MKPCFEILDTKKMVRPSQGKILPKEQFAEWVDATKLEQELQNEKISLKKAAEAAKQQAIETGHQQGFDAGLKKWANQLADLQNQINRLHDQVSAALVPVTLAAVKRIIGKTLEEDPNTFIEIIRTTMKSIAQHRKITIFVNKGDLQRIEEQKNHLKSVFDRVDTFSIVPREDIPSDQCTIESEGGILSVNLNQQLQALEMALRDFFNKGGLSL